MNDQPVIVIGAGIVGTATARALQRDIEKRHGPVDVLEDDVETRMRRAKPVGARLVP